MSGRVYEYRDLTQPRTIDADVCVIGTGCGGSTIAYKLSQRGFKVVLLEQGGYYPTRSFDQDELNMNAKLSAERSMKTSVDGGVILLSGANVGGASVHYWADSFRTPPDRLQLWADRYGMQGHTLEMLTPAWDEISAALNIHEATDEYLNRMNQLVEQAAARLGWKGHRVPQARRYCQKSGHCMQGCVFEAKRSQLVTHLRWAVENNADVYADTRATALHRDGRQVRRLSAVIMDRATGTPSSTQVDIRARAFVLAAGGYNSAAFLMRNGLTSSLPALGRNFAFNPSPMVHGLYDEDIILWRNIPAGFGIDEFRLSRYDAAQRYVEGGYLLMPNQLQPGTLAGTLPLIGARHAQWMRQLARIGSTIGWIDDPFHELGHISVDGNGALKVHYPYGPETTQTLRDLIRKQIQLQVACGAREVVVAGAQALSFKPGDDLGRVDTLQVSAAGLHMAAPHPAGGCVMGASPQDSVVDMTHRVHGFDNLFVADSSVFPTAVSVDPSLTIMGFSYIAAQHVAEHLGSVA